MVKVYNILNLCQFKLQIINSEEYVASKNSEDK